MYRLFVNSFGFYDNNLRIDSIIVKNGQPVELTLFVIDSGTIGTGLEFRGCGERHWPGNKRE